MSALRWVHEYHAVGYSRWVAYEDGFGYVARVVRRGLVWTVSRHKPPQKDPQRVASLKAGKALVEADARGREGRL
jgi:hypothetical protein